jgi:hypothetical protein
MRATSIATPIFVLALAGPAAAQEQVTIVAQPQEDERDRGFIEAVGTYGFSFGVTSYVPDGSPTDTDHPLTRGFGVGGTAGVVVADNLAVIANYEWSQAESREGFVTNVLEEVNGSIDYHTIVAGVRLMKDLGPGRLQAEVALGVVLPFETELEYRYADAMAGLPEPIMGTGTRTSEYNLGVGGHGQVGYSFALGAGAYLTGAVKLRTFQSNNNDKDVVLDNFVDDFQNPEGPQAVDMTMTFDDDGGAPPTTYSVQDIRGQIALGWMF